MRQRDHHAVRLSHEGHELLDDGPVGQRRVDVAHPDDPGVGRQQRRQGQRLRVVQHPDVRRHALRRDLTRDVFVVGDVAVQLAPRKLALRALQQVVEPLGDLEEVVGAPDDHPVGRGAAVGHERRQALKHLCHSAAHRGGVDVDDAGVPERAAGLSRQRKLIGRSVGRQAPHTLGGRLHEIE